MRKKEEFGDGTGAVVIATAEHMPQEVTAVSGTAVNHYFTIDGEELLDFYFHAEGEEQDKEYIAESGSMDDFPGTWYEIAYENMGTENAVVSVTYVDGSGREPLTGTHSVGTLTLLKDVEVSDDFVMAVSKAMSMAGGSSSGHLIDGGATIADGGGSHNIQ